MKVASRYQAVSDAESRARGDRLLAWLREYGERRINSRLIDERRTVPPHLGLDFGREGVFGIQVEERHGGLGLRSREVARVLDQLAAIDLAVGTWLLVCLFPGIRPIAAFGSDALKERWLPDLAAGRVLAGYAQTEPGAGTDFASMAARAVREGDGWRVSGQKVWIGNATWAGLLTVVAQQVDERGRRRGLAAFAVPTDRPGVVLGRELLSMGMRGVVQSEVAFDGVAVDAGDVLGRPERGVEVGVDSMSWSRFAIAATCVGAMKRCLQVGGRFAARRPIATGRLADHPVTQVALGEAWARTACADALLHEVAGRIDAGEAVAAELFAVLKLVTSEFLWEVSDRTVQLLGSRGYDESNLVPQILRDARVTRIFEGASEPLAAFVGAWALPESSELWTLLRERLGAPDVADALAEALAEARDRPWARAGETEPISRHWLCALAGAAASWAILVGLARRDERDGRFAAARSADWAAGRFREACTRLRAGGPDESARFDPPDLGKAAEELVAWIGDVEQQLPGERIGLDPLLRRAEKGD